MRLELAPYLNLSSEVRDGAVRLWAPLSETASAFRVDLRGLGRPAPPYLQPQVIELQACAVTFRLPPAPGVALGPLLRALEPGAQLVVLLALVRALRALPPVSGLSLAGVLVDAEGAIHFTPRFPVLLDHVARGLMWEGDEHRNFCVSSEPARLLETLEAVRSTPWRPAAPIEHLEAIVNSDDARQVLEDELQATQPPLGALVRAAWDRVDQRW